MLENFKSVVLTSVLRKKGIEIQTSLEEEKLLKRFYLLDLVSHIVNIVCHFWGHNKMCSIINHSNAAMIMFQPKDSQNNDIIQVHLCRGNIAIIKWNHGYGSSDDELIVLSWRLCFAIFSPPDLPLLWLYCLTNSYHWQHVSIATVFAIHILWFFCFNAMSWKFRKVYLWIKTVLVMCTVFNLNPELFQFNLIIVGNLMCFVKPCTLVQIFAPKFDFVFLLSLSCVFCWELYIRCI